jgi:hypothetical protein
MSAPSVNHPQVAQSALTCVRFPEQHEGTLTDGRAFLFHLRGGVASLGIGPNLEGAIADSFVHELPVPGQHSEFTAAAVRDQVFTTLMLGHTAAA